MKEEYRWKSLNCLLNTLNESKINYVILRNFDFILNNSSLNNHLDIDFLCDDRKRFVSISRCFPRTKREDNIHYAILVEEKIIPIDIRVIGDGYYDKKWEENILKTKIKKDNFYILNNENYFYSLLYHSIIQKKEIPDDYYVILDKMKSDFTNNCLNEGLQILEEYMKKMNYKYTYPEFNGAVFNEKIIDKNLLSKDIIKKIKRKTYEIMSNIRYNFIKRR